MAWPVTNISDWNHLQEVFDSLDVDRGFDNSYLFRGQPDSNWSLSPSLQRFIKEIPGDLQKYQDIEKNILIEFQSSAHSFLPTNYFSSLTGSYLNWLSTMQHYNTPTRLLDWTISPYVATFFACRENFNTDGAVWLFHPYSFLEKQKKDPSHVEWPTEAKLHEAFIWSNGEKDSMHLYSIRQKNERIISQFGKFSVCTNVLTAHDELIDKRLNTNENPVNLYAKIVIGKNLKVEFLRKLRRYNISSYSLFPGVDGIGASIKELLTSMK